VSYPDAYVLGAELFNGGQYFASHEVWEALWLECDSDERGFYKGLIQAAACLHHLRRDNRRGANSLCRSSVHYLLPYGPSHCGLDLERFCADLERCVRSASTTGIRSRFKPFNSPPRIMLSPPPEPSDSKAHEAKHPGR